MNHVVPPSFLFGIRLPIKACETPKSSRKKCLLNFSDQHRLFMPSAMNGDEQFATVAAGWNPEGLGLKFQITGKPGPPAGDSQSLNTSDVVLIWLDTRPSGDVHRATEYCHHIALLPADERAQGKPAVIAQPIAQQRATRIEFNAKKYRLHTNVSPNGYEAEIWIPKAQLHGYREVAEIGRIGFHCLIKDAHLGDQSFHLSGDFPTGYDPSTWITLELEQ